MMIVRELWREAARHPAALVRSVALLVLVFAAHVAQAVAVAWALSSVVGGHLDHAVSALGTIVGVAVLRLLLSLAQTSASAQLGGEVRRTLRRRATSAALVASRLHDTSVRDGSLRATLGDGIDGTDAYVARYVPAVAQVLVACPAVVAALVVLEPWAGTAVGVALLLALVGPVAWKATTGRRGLDHWDSYEALSADLLESLRGMATLRTLGDVPSTRRRLHERSEALRRATERVMRVSLAETGVTDLAVQAGVVAAAAAATSHAVDGSAPAFEVYLVLLLSSEAFRPVRDLSRHWHAGFLGLTAVPGLIQIGAFRATGAPTRPAPSGTTDQHQPTPHAQQLQVRGVTFRYPGADHAVLDRLDLTAQAGTLTAVVGSSGAGKSTLFDLLLGFLTPEAGAIELDGRPLQAGDIAVVSQRPVLFAGTIRENLAVTGDRSDAELEAACTAAGLADELRALPLGLDTTVTEAGSNLSGGQRQRLALARALLARRPVLLVDEPTSALDTSRADEVVQTLHRVARDHVVVMISHRPEALSEVRSVLRLEAGRLDRSPA